MNIRHRIALLVVLTLSALLAISGMAIREARQSEREVRFVTQGVVPSAAQSMALLTQLKDVQIAAQAMVSASDPALIEQSNQLLQTRKNELQASLSEQAKQADSKAQQGLIEQVQEGLTNYFKAIDDVAKFATQGQRDMAEAMMSANVDQYLREEGEVMQTLQVEKNRSKDEAIAALNASQTRAQTTLTTVSVVALLALTSIGWLLYRQIVRPIGEMQAKMTEIAASQDFSHRLPVRRDDEIGKSVIAFNAMIEKIQQSSEQVRQKTADIHAMLHGIPQGILTI